MNDVKPAGVPVTAALDTSDAAQAAHVALRAIEAVHGDGALPRIPIRMVVDVAFEAVYVRSPEDGTPQAILLYGQSTLPEWALIHEIGHFLDQQTLGERGSFASQNSESFGDWRRAVDATQSVRHLQEMVRDGGVTVVQNGIARHVPVRSGFLATQITFPEIWARSYAQYIATRGGSDVLRAQLRGLLRTSASGGDAPYTLHWEADDFIPVLDAIDRLLQRKGWRQ